MAKPTVHEAVKDTPEGLAVWSVERIWDLAADLPVVEVDFSEHPVLGSHAWGRDLTVREMIEHARRIEAADFTYPVIMGADGRIFDGLHRIAKAVLLGSPKLPTKRFEVDPEPDRFETPAPLPTVVATCGVERVALDADGSSRWFRALRNLRTLARRMVTRGSDADWGHALRFTTEAGLTDTPLRGEG